MLYSLIIKQSTGLLCFSCSVWLCLLTTASVQAQIIPDETLRDRSITTSTGNTVVITGGTRSGTNLFHSFREFSIPTNGTAYFNNDLDVDTIMSRVTGGNASRIDGLLRANGTANLFLLNPSGILFGPNASLNIGGSFLATTAERIDFADGSQFSAVNPRPVLTVSVPVGLQFGATPGEIRNASISNPTFDSNGNVVTVDGLRVASGRTLALLGGHITLAGGVLTAENGQVELGSIADGGSQDDSSGNVQLIRAGNDWRFGYSGITRFQDIVLTSGTLGGAVVDVSGAGGGNIYVQGQLVSLTDGSALVSDTLGQASGGTVEIRAELLSLDDESVISSTSEGSGRAADIKITSDRLILQNGSQIFSSTLADGPTGSLTINAQESILVSGGVIFDDDWFPSGLLTQVDETAIGQGGEVAIATNHLSILDGAQINTTTFGTGQAGDLRLQATTIEIDGSARANGRLFTSFGLPFSSGLFAGTGQDSSGNGGNLIVNAERLSLRNGGTLQTATFGSGDAGNLTATASDVIEIIGRDAEELLPSSLNAASGGITGVVTRGFSDATGQGGTLKVQTRTLRLQDGGAIAVGSINPNGNTRGAGNLNIRANTVELNNQSRLLTETASGNGGDITLQVQDLLLLRRNSQISTSAGVASAGGNGGNITIRASSVLAAPSEDSDIRANAFTGTGGNVTITADRIIGISPSARPTPFSDITASSEFGVNGTIQINTPDVDPNRSLVELPSGVVDATSLIAQTCPTGSIATRQPSSFVVSGRGGLPPSPLDVQQSQPILIGWVVAPNPQPPTPNIQSPIPNIQSPIEAQGWQIGSHGEVRLVAEGIEAIAHTPVFSGSTCN
jgi:filamentous hemagglutinin family protein